MLPFPISRGAAPRTAAAVALVVLCAASPAPARGADGDGEDVRAVSVLGRGVLARTTLLVRGKVQRSGALGFGAEVGTVELLETLRGPAPGGATVQVLTSEKGYFRRYPGEAVFFLKPLSGGTRYEPVAVMDLADGAGEARLAALRRVLEVEALPEGERAGALRKVCLQGLQAEDAWTRRNAARELAHLTLVAPRVFTEPDFRDLARSASREEDPVLRPLLVEAADRLSAASRKGLLAAPGKPPPDASGDARREALLRVLRAGREASLRRDAARLLSEVDGEDVTGALAAALLKDQDAGVRQEAAIAMAARPATEAATAAFLDCLRLETDGPVLGVAVEALGFLKAEKAVEPLVALARRDSSRRGLCLFALARIATPAARAAMDDMRRAAAGGTEDDERVRSLVRYLLSPEFEEQEKTLRRLRRP